VITFNDILRIEGIDPRQVRLVRHLDNRVRNPSLYEVWRSAPKLLEEYQAVQSRDVFKVGEILASFVVTPRPRRETLFIGLYLMRAVRPAPKGSRDPILGVDVSGKYLYTIEAIGELSEYVGRLTIHWGVGSRAWHQRASRQDKVVAAIQDEIDPPFPGFDRFAWDLASIDDMPPGWKEHFRHVKGVYLLVDTETGARYVGSATGDESLWGRFRSYFETGHGGNVELRRLGKRPYRVSVLQIGGFDDEILAREREWKQKLMTREFGLNAN
jgi:GIY-YIG catalytic domain